MRARFRSFQPCRLLRRFEVDAAAPLAIAAAGAMALWLGSCGTLPFEFPGFASSSPPPAPERSRAAPLSVAAPAAHAEPVLRIRLRKALEQAVVSGPARAMVGLAARSGDNELLATPLTITRSGAVWQVKDARGLVRAFVAVGEGELSAGLLIERSGPALLNVQDTSYRGELVLLPSRQPASPTLSTVGDGLAGAAAIDGTVRSGASPDAAPSSPGHFDLLERVGIEEYIAGVVAKEIPASWEATTHRVQAIIARSYALHERDRASRLNRSYDLEAGESDQAYAGAVVDPKVQSAVRATRGAILTHQGRTLRAYYSSTCGGRSAAAANVWPTTAGFEFNLDRPIQGHPQEEFCSASPLYRWSVTRPRSELTQRITAFGRDSGMGVRKLSAFSGAIASETNSSGRPTRYKVFDSDGTWWPMDAEQLRMACNWTGSSGLPPTTRASRVNSGDATFQLHGDQVVISGRGFGHGAGLCQYGAQGMAKQGKGEEEILRFYYPGARIESAY